MNNSIVDEEKLKCTCGLKVIRVYSNNPFVFICPNNHIKALKELKAISDKCLRCTREMKQLPFPCLQCRYYNGADDSRLTSWFKEKE